MTSEDLPLAETWISAPEENRQPNHEEGMRAEIGSDCEVAVKSRCAERGLQPGEVGCLPSDQGQRKLSEAISPWRQRIFVY